MSIIDNNLLSGTQHVTITGTVLLSDQDWILSKINSTSQDIVRIYDNESAVITLEIPENYRISASYTEGESYLSEPLCLTVGQRIYSLPDSPDAFEYDTYFEKNWYALNVDDISNINKVRLQYQWEATENPTPCTIESITPFEKMWMINEAGEPNGFYEKSIGIFSSYPVTGI